MARADMHVFGSVSGYRTVAASPGLRADETRELEHFQFGEISTSDAIARLETQPTMTSRMLSSGRMALSRMLPAGVDDAGRPTIEIVTFVVDAKSYHTSLGSLAVLADDASFWVAARDNARAGFDLPRGDALLADPRDPALLRILDAWMLATRTGSVATLPESSMADLLRFVATLDPSDRARCRWGVGINSLSAPVDVCTMMPGASTRGARSIVRPAPAGQWHVRETEFAQFRATSGGSTWVPTAQMIGAATVSSAESSVGDARDAFASTSAHRALSDRQKRVMVMSIIAAICSTLLFTVAATVYLGTASSRSNNVVLAGGAGGGAVGGAGDPIAPLPPIGGSRRSGFGEAIDIPAVSAPTEIAGPPEPQAAPPEPEFETVYLDSDDDGYGDSEKSKRVVKGSAPKGYVSKAGDCNDRDDAINPDARETCDDVGIDNNCDGSVRDVDSGEMVIDIYLDQDKDTYGDPKQPRCVCASAGIPDGYVNMAGDECPENPTRQKEGECGCAWTGADEDLDEDKSFDCLQDDDGDTQLNRDDPDYVPNSGLRPLLRKLKSIREEIESATELVSMIDGQRLKDESFESFIERLGTGCEGVATHLSQLGENLQNLQREQRELAKSGGGFPFVQRIWTGLATPATSNPNVKEAWREIVTELQSLANSLQGIREIADNAASQFSVGGNNQKSDYTRGMAKSAVERAWGGYQRNLAQYGNLVDQRLLSKELAALGP